VSETRTVFSDGVAYILPRSEPSPKFVRKVGRFGVGVCIRWTSWGIGFDILRAGLLLAIGPAFVFIAHIDRTLAPEPPSGGGVR
jgi:hypothetical protein